MAKQKNRRGLSRSGPPPRPQVSKLHLSLPPWLWDTIALIGLLGGVIVFFWAILSQQAFLWEDIPKQWYPMASYTASELLAGRFPFWNPYIFGGIPFFAMIDVGVLYPLNWLFIYFVDNMILSYIVVEFHLIAHVYLI
ncbi:MAG: hypothetical protein VYA69_10540, partial [Gemmatimonadota bacterium]|nr:hypothetical protein [Gemmatimonadota bacterium]